MLFKDNCRYGQNTPTLILKNLKPEKSTKIFVIIFKLLYSRSIITFRKVNNFMEDKFDIGKYVKFLGNYNIDNFRFL